MTTDSGRRVLIVVNPRSDEARMVLPSIIEALAAGGVTVRLTEEDCADLTGFVDDRVEVVASDENAGDGAELVVVLGGDGTMLRAAERARVCGAPLLGVKLGHVGFLAEAEPEDLHAVVAAVLARRWVVEERLVLDVRVLTNGDPAYRT